jgi:hypothetical protein
MKNQDNLSKYFRELPVEEPSGNFTMLVMDRVRLETKKAHIEYAPLISTRIWWKISIIITLTLLAGILLQTYFPAKETSGGISFLSNLDFSFLSEPFVLLSKVVNYLTVTHVFVLMGISFLLLFDKFYSRFAG